MEFVAIQDTADSNNSNIYTCMSIIYEHYIFLNLCINIITFKTNLQLFGIVYFQLILDNTQNVAQKFK